jgi:hypothetical protein
VVKKHELAFRQGNRGKCSPLQVAELSFEDPRRERLYDRSHLSSNPFSGSSSISAPTSNNFTSESSQNVAARQARKVLICKQPMVWRRIQVPADYTLARLHRVIQAVMDWQYYHLHEFTVKGRAYGEPEQHEENRLLDERTLRLRDLGLRIGDRFEYVYDFGDNWQHVLELEDTMLSAVEAVYPLCVGGENTTHRRMSAESRDTRSSWRPSPIRNTKSTRT